MEKVFIEYLNKRHIKLYDVFRIFYARHINSRSGTAEELPECIGRYQLVKTAIDDSESRKYRIAVYQAKGGARAYLKLWEGLAKGPAYYGLLNELRIYSILSTLPKSKAAGRSSKVSIPRLLHVIHEEHRLGILVSAMDGMAIDRVPLPRRLRELQRVLTFMDTLYVQLHKNSDLENSVLEFSFAHERILFLMALCMATFTHPTLFFKAVHAAYKYVRCARLASLYSRRTLVHRDLARANVLYKEGVLSVIDFEATVKASKALEIAQMLVEVCNNPGLFRQYAHRLARTMLQSTESSRAAYVCTSLYVAFLHLGTKQQYSFADYSLYLNYVLSL